jgi:alpha/beta superfamily hydrolase
LSIVPPNSGCGCAMMAMPREWPAGRSSAMSSAPAALVAASAHLNTLVVHGEQDDTVLLSAVLDWARPQALPVTVVPGVGHFFHGQLTLLKNLVIRHLACPVL